MKSRATFAVALALASMGCEALVGIGDLPIDGDGSTPVDGAGPTPDVSVADVKDDRKAPRDATRADDAAVDAAVDAAGGDGAADDGAADDVMTRDVAPRDAMVRETGPRDAAMDRAAADGPTLTSDASDASVDRKPIPDAALDRTMAAACPLLPADAGGACQACLQANCCDSLAACQQSGTGDGGQTGCIQLTNATLLCVLALGDTSPACAQAAQYSPADQMASAALVSCLQQSCAVQCGNVIAIPGT